MAGFCANEVEHEKEENREPDYGSDYRRHRHCRCGDCVYAENQYRRWFRELKDTAVITPGQEDHVCTITIVCDTILDNTNNLNEEKAPFVPRNGTILPKTRVSFAEGDTVFEVLNKVCKAADIQIEYSWTPMYNSYYIEGINHLYEFDVGPESGWMYKVDEWFPNYGCSAYKLQDGQDIVWCYTCNGLGADVGEFWMG